MSAQSNQLTAGLTDNQKAAVLSPPEGRLKISAGAGSGKTEVLTRRIRGILEGGLEPSSMVAITYTNKAAAEMKNRLATKQGLDPSIMRQLHVSTFHGFLRALLMKDPFGAGIDTADSVISEPARKLLLEALLERFGRLHGEKCIFGPEGLTPAHAKRLVGYFPFALSRVRRYLLSPAGFYDLCRKKFSVGGCSQIESNCLEWLFRFFALYIQALDEQHVMDFDEILRLGDGLITGLVEAGSSPVQRVFLIDEFQDNNREQLRIVEKFIASKDADPADSGRRTHLTVVGDSRQSIYRFQGAELEVFTGFKGTGGIVLDQNFRSYQEIVSLAQNYLNLTCPPEDALSPDKAVLGSSPRKGPVRMLLSDSRDDRLEAAEVATIVKKLAGGGIRSAKTGKPLKFGDIAVIVNSIRLLPKAFEDSLLAHGIPYIMSGGFGFYDRSEISEVVSIMRLITTPDDDHAAAKVLTGSLFGLKDSQLAEMARKRRHEKTGLLDLLMALPEASLPQRASEFREFFLELIKRSETMTAIETAYYILENGGFLEHAASQKSVLKRRRMENNLAKLLEIVRNFERTGVFTTLKDFLSYLERVLNSEVEEDEAGLGLEEGDAVKVMTIHKSKGLEFPVVILPFVRKKGYRKSGVIHFTQEDGLLIDLDQDSSERMSQLVKSYHQNQDEKHSREEGRKLYVAMTRAEELLIVSGAGFRAEKPDEPLFRLKQLIDSDPSTGSVHDITAIGDVMNEWGTSEDAVPKATTSPGNELASSPDGLANSIRAYKDFLVRKNAPLSQQTERVEQVFSLMGLELYRLCRRRYYFNSLGIGRVHDGKASFSIRLGNLVHAALRLFHLDTPSETGQNDRLMIVQQIIIKTAGLYGESEPSLQDKALSIFEKYLEHPLSLSTPWLLEAEVNLRVECETGSFFIRGFADRVDRDGGEISVIDYKTHAHEPERHSHYADQTALYLAAARKGVLGEMGQLNFASASILYLTDCCATLHPSESDPASFEARAAKTVDQIRLDRTWLPNPGEHCKTCHHILFCRTDSNPQLFSA